MNDIGGIQKKIDCDFIKIKGSCTPFQGKGYYMHGLVENKLISTKSYSRMKREGKMTTKMKMAELVFKDDSTFIIWHDADINLPLLDGCNGDHITKVGSLYKCITDPTNLNLSPRAKQLVWWHYKLVHIIFKCLMQLARWNIISEHLFTFDVS